MSHIAPGEGSPNDNPAINPEQPYEPQQGTGDAERPQEQVDELQESELEGRDQGPDGEDDDPDNDRDE
jgi:hypothetical protein